jgi:EmrB/QacA subfamily drug resistance transporter
MPENSSDAPGKGAAATGDTTPAARTGAVVGVLCLGLFMTLLDLTIVNIAIPDLVDDLGSSLDQVLWVLNAYSLVYAVLLITTGRLGDILGPRTMYLAGLAVFTLASAGTGLASSTGLLIGFRAGQGLGAAMLAPQTLAFVTALLPPKRRAGAFAAIGGITGLAVLAGPTLGGFIVTHWGWRWIFFVNLPIGVVTFVLCLLLVPDVRPGVRHRLDLLGVLLLTLGLLGVVYGLIEGERYSWGTITGVLSIPLVLALGVVVLVVFLVREARNQRREPLLSFEVFRNRNFSLMALVLGVMGFSIVGLYLPLTIYFQSVLGLSAVAAGLALAPQPLVAMFTSAFCGALSQRIPGKFLLVPGLLVLALGSTGVVLGAQADSGRWHFVPWLVVAGLGMGAIWVPVFSIATENLPPRLAGVGAGVLDTVQELGSVLATAVIGALLSSRLATSLHAEAVARSSSLPPSARDGFIAGFDATTADGLQVGATGSDVVPHDVPATLAARLAQLGHDVFAHGFVNAMRPTMLVPVVLLVVAGLATLAVRNPAPDRPAGGGPLAEAR